jgi:hypothetical protein
VALLWSQYPAAQTSVSSLHLRTLNKGTDSSHRRYEHSLQQ